MERAAKRKTNAKKPSQLSKALDLKRISNKRVHLLDWRTLKTWIWRKITPEWQSLIKTYSMYDIDYRRLPSIELRSISWQTIRFMLYNSFQLKWELKNNRGHSIWTTIQWQNFTFLALICFYFKGFSSALVTRGSPQRHSKINMRHFIISVLGKLNRLHQFDA